MYFPLAGGVWAVDDLTATLSAPPAAHAPTPPAASPAAWLASEFRPDLAHPKLTAPVYGAVQAGLSTADLTGTLPTWVGELATDPSLRVAAGLGVAVVRRERESLVAAAFDQVGDVNQVNAQLGRAQLARAVGDRHVTRHLTGYDDLTTLQLLGPHASRLSVSGQSAFSLAASSPAGQMASAAYRRLTRPRGPHAQAAVGAQPAPPAAVPGPIPASALLQPLGLAAAPVTGRVYAEFVTPPAAALAAGNSDRLRQLAPQVTFGTPMIGPLIELSADAVLANAGEIPMNTALSLEDNPATIIAYLIGLNHETERLFQWRDVPTDRRGTPFTAFWGGSTSPLTAIATWDTPTSSPSLQAEGGSAVPVLAVRAELFLRYPRTAVYAVQAQAPPQPRFALTPTTPVINPSAEAILPPDVRLFVFDGITINDQTGWDSYFFVFQEQVSETRFGAPGDNNTPASGGTHWTVSDVCGATGASSIADAGVMADAVRKPPAFIALNAKLLIPT
jgi:hypothetical protein